MKINRRNFMKTVGIFGTGLVAFNPTVMAFTANKRQITSVLSNGWHPSTCQGCTTWCPIQVYVQDGRAIKVRGNVNSLINKGKVCSKSPLMIQQAYDPDRIKVPLKRTNPIKGPGVDPGFIPISWSEAINTIADKMMELRATSQTHKFMLLRGRYSEQNEILYSALPKIFGSPNGISHSSLCAEAEKSGAYYTEGYWDYRDYDLANTKVLVLWGVDPFRSNRMIPSTMQHWPNLIKNATIITVDPALTIAASKSHEWLPIKPGEDGALASAIAHHILVKGIWNKTFVGDFNGTGVSSFVANTEVNESHFGEIETNGLIRWWNIELKDKTPAWASVITGISEEQIIRVAEKMGNNSPNVAVWFGPGPTMSPKGTYTGMAINALNGLLGSVDNYGGSVRRMKAPGVKSPPSTSAYQDDLAKTGAAYPKIDQRGTLTFPALNSGKSGGGVVTNNVPNAILAEDPYDIKVAIGYWCNFAFSGTQPQRWHRALEKIPFFAHITTNACETTQFADIVLPAAFSSLEKLSFIKTAANLHAEISIQQPVAKRLFDVKMDETEIAYLLAAALKDKGFSSFYDYLTQGYIDPDTGLGASNASDFPEIVTKYFTEPAYKLLDGGWEAFKVKGVVSKGPVTFKSLWGGKFGTKTGKFEFYSETLKTALQQHADKHITSIDEVLQVCNYDARGDLAFVPHYEKPLRHGDTENFPLTFIDVKSRFNREGRSQNTPWYYQFKKLDPGSVNWGDNLCINPADAAIYQISDGDQVRVKSPTGELISKVKLWEGVRPGTMLKTYGGGHWAYGRFASNYSQLKPKGGNNNDILADDYDRISGSTARNGGFAGVSIEKI